MPNLVLTTTCNRSCPYCFALAAGDGSPRADMTFREVVRIADRAVADGIPSVGLLGGEPTLHPEFEEIATYLIRRGLVVCVFTNGLVPADALRGLEGQPRERLQLVVNVNAPEIEPPGNHDRQVEFLRRFRANADLGVNVFRPDLDLGFVLDVADRADLRGGRIRVGLAQPVVGEANVFLRPEDHARVAASLVALAEAAIARRLRLSLDCGFPLCAFTEAEVGRLHRLGASLRFYCRPALDLAPGGEAWSCFPLARTTRTSPDGGESLREVANRFATANAKARERAGGGIFEACRECLPRSLDLCDGGCLAHVLAREAGAPPASPAAGVR